MLPTLVVPVGTVLEYLCLRFAHIAQLVWCQRMSDGLVVDADRRPLSESTPYRAGLVVYYFRHVLQEPVLPYVETVLYADDYVVVADKPHFLPVTPSGPYVRETLLARLKSKLRLNQLSPMHRIDRDTAGLVLFCVQPQHRGAYQALFRDGKIRKQYEAIAPKLSMPLPHEIRLRLEDSAKGSPGFMQTRVVPGTPNSVTHIVSMSTIDEQPDLARYTLQPVSGRRHQIRAHLNHINAPIVGDQIYPVLMPERDISTGVHQPLQLLAQRLKFTDPITHANRSFESNLALNLSL